MSPRNPPIQLQQVPGTPTQSHALPPIHHPAHPSAPHPPPSVTSPPPTPSAANRPTSLSANAGPFVPGKKISIKNPSGQEVNIDALKRPLPQVVPVVPVVPPSPASSKTDVKRPIRIESQAQKEKRLAEERAREGESDEKIRTSETFTRANEDVVRRQIEERELRNVEERKLKEEVERAEKARKEAEERAAREEKERKEAEERAAREEEERKEAEERAAREAREAEEREKESLRLEEEARARREAEERVLKERAEQDRLRTLKEEEEAKEAAERLRKTQEEALRAAEAEAEAAEASRALVDADAKHDSLPEEGEIEDEVSRPTTAEEALPNKTSSVPPPAPIPADLSAKSSDKEPLRIDTSIPSPEPQRRRPGPLNLQTTITSNIPPALPSALATARHIEDINRITYPEGIKSPKIELNVNTQKGKFRYVLSVIDIPYGLNNFPW